MAEKKSGGVKGALEVFAKSMVQPLLYLSVAGILLVIGIVLTNSSIVAAVPFLSWTPIAIIGDVIYESMMYLINNLSVIFCVGIAMAMAKKDKGHAALIALMAYLIYLNANYYTLSGTGSLAEASSLTGLYGTGQTTVFGFQVTDTGVFGGIVLGCLCGWAFNKFCNKQFGPLFAMFSGVRFAFLIIVLISWALGIAMCYIWPPVQWCISALASVISSTGNFGLFLYGVLNKLLVPTGLHHLVYAPFEFTEVGGTLTLGDTTYAGAYIVRMVQISAGLEFSEETYYCSFAFNNLWPYIGIGLAFITTAYPQNKTKTKTMMIPLMLAAVLSCITEPMDFLFVFVSPMLWIVHSLLSGVFLVLLKVLSIPASTAGGLINIIVSNLVIGIEQSNWPMMIVLGVIDAVVYYFLFVFLIKKFDIHTPGREVEEEAAVELEASGAVAAVAAPAASEAAAPEGVDPDIAALIEGLGGKDNIEDLENCFTRLRVALKDASLINEDLINRVKNSGIVKNDNDIQIVYGMQVAEMRNKVEDALSKM